MKDNELVNKYTSGGMSQDGKPDNVASLGANQQEKTDDRPYSMLSVQQGREVALDLRLSTGDSETFPYSYLVRKKFDRSGTITLKFSDSKVFIKGIRLQELNDALTAQKVTWISEGDESYDELSEEKPFVSSIEIEEAI